MATTFASDPILWGGSSASFDEFLWGGSPISWGEDTTVPPHPDALNGVAAPAMLGYLPDYWAPNSHLRSILQGEGMEFDAIWDLVRSLLATMTNPLTCPEWALGMWETMLELGDRSMWTVAERRTGVAAFFAPAVTEDQVISFLAAQVPTDPVNITVSVVPE